MEDDLKEAFDRVEAALRTAEPKGLDVEMYVHFVRIVHEKHGDIARAYGPKLWDAYQHLCALKRAYRAGIQ